LAVLIFVASILVIRNLAFGGGTTTVGGWYRDLSIHQIGFLDRHGRSCWLWRRGRASWTDAVDDGPGPFVILSLFGLNIVLHMPPLFFAPKRPDWALVEVPLLWLSVAALKLTVGRYSSLAVWLLLSYLLWVTFAAFLNLKIVRLNRPFGELA
jgi:translocator protein